MRYSVNWIFFIFSIVFSSCDLKTSEGSLPESVGKYGQILIVIDTLYENGETGALIDSILAQELYGLPQAEPLFNRSTVPPAGFKSVLKRASNVIRITVGKGVSTGIELKSDVWAKGQTVVEVSGVSSSVINRMLRQNSVKIIEAFNSKERRRWNRQFTQFSDAVLISQIEEGYDVSLKVTNEFEIIDTKQNGFWLKKEKMVGGHQVIQGIMVYYSPYISTDAFGKNQMISNRNGFTENYITGMAEGSYMSVYEDYPVRADTIKVNGMYAVEYRGLWKMKNDFMGGPFLHFTILDEDNSRIIDVDVFVYAPKFKKREYLRELEAIARSLQIPSNSKED